MSEQLRLGGAPPASAVTSEVDCGSAGSTRAVLVLVERPDGTVVERLELRDQNRTKAYDLKEAGALAAALMKAISFSERRRTRRGVE